MSFFPKNAIPYARRFRCLSCTNVRLQLDKVPHEYAFLPSDVTASACLLLLRRSWLFPQIDAALHHGGAGTTGASLRGKGDLFGQLVHLLT
jgi:hypothetical protein